MSKLSNILDFVFEDYRFEKLYRRGLSNGLVAMMRALEKGHDVGVLTARGSLKGNEPIIKLIERFTKNKIKYNIFVNDPSFAKNMRGDSTALKKLQILIEFRNGIGHSKIAYDKVKFFEDEQKNIDAVENRSKYVKQLFPEQKVKIDNIKVYDIKGWDYNKLDKEISSSNNKVISFFDLDGTVIHTNAKIYIVDKNSGKQLDAMTQEEFAVHGNERFEKILKDNPNAVFDLSEFSNKQKVKKQVSLQAIKQKEN